MKINIDGRNYSFKFYHENPATHTTRLNKIGEEIPVRIVPAPERATTCVVFNENGDEVTRGTANVHPDDNFCKEKGRQIAIKRAIFSWDLPYKTQVWSEYRTWGKTRW